MARALAASVVALACACEPVAARTPAAARRPPACAEGAADRSLVLPSRAFAVAVADDGRYVLALGSGVAAVDPCTLDRVGGCDDPGEARSLALDGAVARYARRDGARARCDLRTGVVSVDGAPPPAARGDAWVEAGVAWIRPPAGPRRLPTPAEALDVTLAPALALAATGDRAGVVSLWSTRDGTLVARWPAHPRNAYGVAFDVARRRVVSVSGPGKLNVHALPERAEVNP